MCAQNTLFSNWLAQGLPATAFSHAEPTRAVRNLLCMPPAAPVCRSTAHLAGLPRAGWAPGEQAGRMQTARRQTLPCRAAACPAGGLQLARKGGPRAAYGMYSAQGTASLPTK